MKILRSIAFGIIGLCMIGCIVILAYSSKKSTGDDSESVVAISDSDTDTSRDVVITDGEVTVSDVLDAASVIISDVKDDITEAVASVNDTPNEEYGEISYAEIVRLEEEEVALQQKADVEASNKANGIVTSTSSSTESKTSTSATVTSTKTYAYVVNKTTGKIHRSGCLLEPSGTNAAYYDTLAEAIKDGYKEKCTVCSP